jgi:CheY-like chemotaxis protein
MKTILVVDDEYAFVENLTELLQDEGYRVASAANGKDGLERAQTERPDLIVTDLMMPIADGRELVRGVRATVALCATPIILMSATTRDVALAAGEDTLEVSAFLRKPIRWEQILETIVGLIGPGESARR